MRSVSVFWLKLSRRYIAVTCWNASSEMCRSRTRKPCSYLKSGHWMSVAPNATPFLRFKNMPWLLEAMLLQFRSTERRLPTVPKQTSANQEEISGVEEVELGCKPDHHPRQWQGRWLLRHNLNKLLLPGRTLGTSSPAVLLYFREHHPAFLCFWCPC